MGKKKERKEESAGQKILAAIVGDAMKWAIEGGLKGPFHTNVEIKDFGFVVEIIEKEGRGRSAGCTFTKDGARSMYELRA